jgi:hypothetical protein
MESFSIWYWLAMLAMWFIFLWPLGRVVRRTGHAAPWAILAVVPVVNVILLWIWAYKRWPQQAQDAAAPPALQ